MTKVLKLQELPNRNKRRGVTSLRLTQFVARTRSTTPYRTLFYKPQKASGYVTQRN
jgi:hypothetical protein